MKADAARPQCFWEWGKGYARLTTSTGRCRASCVKASMFATGMRPRDGTSPNLKKSGVKVYAVWFKSVVRNETLKCCKKRHSIAP